MNREPTEKECFEIGRGPAEAPPFRHGWMPDTADERKRFEAYMRGHCWDFGSYDLKTLSYDTVMVRMLYGVWRDRGYLATVVSQAEANHD